MVQAFTIKSSFACLMLLAYATMQSSADVCSTTDPCPDLKFTNTDDKCTADNGAGTCVCTDTSCTCSAGYTLDGAAGSATCKLIAPTVTVASGSMEVGYGNAITLTCDTADTIVPADIGDGNYFWIIDAAAPVAGSGSRQLTEVVQDRTVKCSIAHDDVASLNSPESASVSVTVVARDGATCEDEATCTANGYISGTCSLTETGVCSCQSGNECTVACNADTSCTDAQFNGAQTCSISATGICTCQANDCTCGVGYTFSSASKKCLAGLVCTEDAQCTTGNDAAAEETPYSTCNTDLGVCNCADGYHVSGSACIRSGKECTEANADSDCSGEAYADPRSCDSNQRCECAADYTIVFGECSTDKGKPCTQTTRDIDCPSTESKYTGTCEDERCECATGSEQVVGDCSGAAAMAGSLLLLALTTVMSRLF